MSKFSDDTCEALHDLSLDGFLDGECGSVSECGEWYGLLLDTGIEDAPNAILVENDQGFVDYTVYEFEERARLEFERIEVELYADTIDE